MNQIQQSPKSFQIEYRGKNYICDCIEINNTLLYRVNFPGSGLYLTRGTGRDGSVFWSCIPQDLKLRHVVHELGEKIIDYYKQNGTDLRTTETINASQAPSYASTNKIR